MPSLQKLLRKLKTQRDGVSHSGSGSPVNPPVSESSTNTASNGQQALIVPLSDAQQATRVQPQSYDLAEKQGLRTIHLPSPASDDDEDRVGNSLDIVAVHGITGNAYDTWIHGNGTFWLRDLIPKDLPGVRIFSYRYPTDVFCTFAIGTIDIFTRSLLESLKRERKGKDVCPLFICS